MSKMTKRISAIMRQTWYEAAKRNLAGDERLAFYEAVYDYCFLGEQPQRTKTGDKGLLMFDMIRAELDDDKEKLQRIQERNRVNGSRGGRPIQIREQNITNPVGYLGFNENPDEPSRTQKTPIHNNTLQNNTTAATAAGNKAAGSGGLDDDFFEAQLWPRLNASGSWSNRHRKCLAAWQTYSERKRAAIVKAVLSDAFAGKDNPFYYLEDFKEPGAAYLSNDDCYREWKSGRTVYSVQIAPQVWKMVSEDDFTAYELSKLPYKIFPPKD